MANLYATLISIFLIIPTIEARTVRDSTGRLVEIRDPVQRIVSLAPSCAEIITGLHLQTNLVGITIHTDYPAEILHLPRVGSYVHLNVEAILNLRPDLVVATNDGNPPEVIERLEKLEVPVFVLDLTTYASIQQSIRKLGESLHQVEEAENRVQEMQRVADCISSKTNAIRPVRLLFVYQTSPIVSPGPGTFTDELIQMAGGNSLTRDFSVSYPRLSLEQVIRLDPEVLILSTMAGENERKTLEEEWNRWPMISAVRNHRVHAIDSRNLDRPSHRIVFGLYQLASLLHPESFKASECEPLEP
jgi:cobalamin transport system substrate-binding protein